MLDAALVEPGLGIVYLNHLLHKVLDPVVKPLPYVLHCGGTGVLHPALNVLLNTGQFIAADAYTKVVRRNREHGHIHLELGSDVVVVGIVLLAVERTEEPLGVCLEQRIVAGEQVNQRIPLALLAAELSDEVKVVGRRQHLRTLDAPRQRVLVVLVADITCLLVDVGQVVVHGQEGFVVATNGSVDAMAVGNLLGCLLVVLSCSPLGDVKLHEESAVRKVHGNISFAVDWLGSTLGLMPQRCLP